MTTYIKSTGQLSLSGPSTLAHTAESQIPQSFLLVQKLLFDCLELLQQSCVRAVHPRIDHVDGHWETEPAERHAHITQQRHNHSTCALSDVVSVSPALERLATHVVSVRVKQHMILVSAPLNHHLHKGGGSLFV